MGDQIGTGTQFSQFPKRVSIAVSDENHEESVHTNPNDNQNNHLPILWKYIAS